MLIYLALFGMAGGLILFEKYSKMKKSIKRILVCTGLALAVFLMFALRHQSMGIDLHYLKDYGYLGSFEKIGSKSWKEVLTMESYQNYERGYILFNKLVASVSMERQFFLAVCAFCSVAPIAWTIYKKSESPALSFIAYMGMPFFVLTFSGLRQSIAIGLCVWALSFVQEKKPVRFVLLVLLASTFHSTALLFLAAYPAYYIRLSRRLRWATVFLLPLVYLHAAVLFPFVSIFMGGAVMDNNGAVELFLVFMGVYALCISMLKNSGTRQKGYADMLMNKDTVSPDQEGLLNLFWIGCACQGFSGVFALALRLAYYFLAPLVLLLPSLVKYLPKGKLIRIKRERKPLEQPKTYLPEIPVYPESFKEKILRKWEAFLDGVKRVKIVRWFATKRPIQAFANFWREEKRTVLTWIVAVCLAAFGLYMIGATYWSMSYPYYFFWEPV